jgi:ABC-type bacteriocin/lantibiotic exporter with double-glycine peptidase domain
VSDAGYGKLYGHATSKAMQALRVKQGAIFHPSGITHNWYGTERTAYFYTQFLTQTKEYTCGVFALAYLLELRGIRYSFEYLEHYLNTTEEDGTNPKNIQKFLSNRKIKHTRPLTLQEYSIVDFFHEDDGHWITLLDEKNDREFNVYDPNEGYTSMSKQYILDNWYSPRYGKKWILRLV